MNKRVSDVFPIRLYCTDIHYADSPALARSIWARHRNGRTWYAADCSILDAMTVEVYVYEMADSFSGGIGKEIYRLTETKFTKDEQEMLSKIIRNRQWQLAETEWERRRNRQRENEIEKLRQEMYG